MRKAIGVSMALLLLLGAALALVAGCGGGAQNSDTKARESASSSISESELEALIYPGAQEEDLSNGAGMSPPDGTTAPTAPPDRPEGTTDSSAPPMSSAPGGPSGTDGGQAPPGGMQRPADLAAYWTGDSIDKVSVWYVEQLSGKTGFEEMKMPSRGGSDQSQQDGSMKAYSLELGETTVRLMLRTDTQDRGGTIITIGEAPQGMPSAPSDSQN